MSLPPFADVPERLAVSDGTPLVGPQPPSAPRSGTAMAYTQGLRGYANAHEQMTRMEVVRRLAALKGYAVSEEFAQPPVGAIYLVPSDTVAGLERARALGMLSRDDFFGGVVPWPFVATKAITHGLVQPHAPAPEGWSHDFSRLLGEAALPGFTAFSRTDAARALDQLLAGGPVRIKPVRETGGNGQTVVHDEAGGVACLDRLDEDTLARDGVVLERNLRQVETLSVGQVHVAGIVASYYGVQRLTRSRRGAEVYGGSDLTVVRGDFHALLAQPLSREVRIAVEQALLYDSAASACFAGLLASRINYDVAQGLLPDGSWRSGVLEQSWRAGGATGAEIAALEAFQADPTRRVVRASTHEVHGVCEQLPPGAVLYFRGEDEVAGPLTKFATLSIDDHQT